MVLPPRPEAILFDLDGTLVDSKRDIAEALNVALAAVDRSTQPLEEVGRMIGDGARMLCARGLGSEASDADLLERTLHAFQVAYRARPCVHTTLLPGADEALALDVKRALVTNKQRAVTRLVLEHLGVVGAFDAVYAGGDGPLKPAPDGAQKVLATLGVPASLAWLVGDGPQDVLAGRAAGCFTIAVPGIADQEHVLAAKPDLVISSLHELAPLVRSAPPG
jgi:phosphoglycolate phosphatase